MKLFGDDGVAYYYTHLDGFGAKGRVSAGTVIGYVGNTATPPGGRPTCTSRSTRAAGPAVNPYPRIVARLLRPRPQRRLPSDGRRYR